MPWRAPYFFFFRLPGSTLSPRILGPLLIVFQIGQQALVRQIKRPGIFPIVMNDIVQTIHDLIFADFNCQFTAAVKTSRGQVDRSHNRPERRRPVASWHAVSDV